MHRTEWINLLAEKIRPRSPIGAANRLTAMLAEMEAEPAWLFDEASARYVAARCPSTPNLARLQQLLREFRRQHEPQQPTPHTAPPELQQEWRAQKEREEFLRRDWDDPVGITRKVRDLDQHPMRNAMLHQLGIILAKHAPQHLGLLPTSALDEMWRNGSPPLRATIDPHRSRQDQLNALDDAQPTVSSARHLTPAQLDIVNPLPAGRKRVTTT